MTAAIYTDVAPTAITLASDGSVPMVPGPPYGHDYRVVHVEGLDWYQAQTAAKALGAGWDLATITSEAEQAFISRLLGIPPATGIHQYWIGGEQLEIDGVFIEPGGNWQWINNEGVFWNNVGIEGGTATGMYSNWGVGEPNNVLFGGTSTGPQNHLAMDNRFDLPRGWGWDDNDHHLSDSRGFVAERVTPPSGPVIP